MQIIGEASDCRESFFVLTAQRKLKYPALVEITRVARNDLFAAAWAEKH